MKTNSFPFSIDGENYRADRTFGNKPAVYEVIGFDANGKPYVNGLGDSRDPVSAEVVLVGLRTGSVIIIGEKDYSKGGPKG
jgi:hypothetical protein